MREFEYVQILYAFHFDSLPKNEHETRSRFLPRSLEFSKRRNVKPNSTLRQLIQEEIDAALKRAGSTAATKKTTRRE
jgi:hypothetical protein